MYPEYIGNGNGRWLIRSAIELFQMQINAQKFYEHFEFTKYDDLESSLKNRFLPQMELINK